MLGEASELQGEKIVTDILRPQARECPELLTGATDFWAGRLVAETSGHQVVECPGLLTKGVAAKAPLWMTTAPVLPSPFCWYLRFGSPTCSFPSAFLPDDQE